MGDARVDVHGWQQGLALTAGLNFAPRPAFQSYGAFTDRLARRNEAHLLDPAHAPAAVLLKLQPIDGRLASSEDPLALTATLRAYQPVEREAGFLLMQRHAATIPPVPRRRRLPGDRWHSENGSRYRGARRGRLSPT